MLKTLFILLCLVSWDGAIAKKRAPASRGVQRVEKALSVKGQSRTLSMMMVLKNKKEEIGFFKVRRNFRKEILRTQY